MEISLCFCRSKGLASPVCRREISTIFPPAFPLPSPRGVFIMLHWRYSFCELFCKAAQWTSSPSKAEIQRWLYKWWVITVWGSGRRQTSLLNADGREVTIWASSTTRPSPTITSTAWGSYLSTPEFCSSLVPRPSSLLLTGGVYFLEPIWLSFLKLHLPVEHEGWPLLACPHPGFPCLYGQCFFARLWNQPIFKQRLPSMGLSKPESLLSHLHNLAAAGATYTIILCMLLSQVNPLFWNVNIAKGSIICHKCNSTVDSTQTKWC